MISASEIDIMRTAMGDATEQEAVLFAEHLERRGYELGFDWGIHSPMIIDGEEADEDGAIWMQEMDRFFNGKLLNPATGSVAAEAEWRADFANMTPEEWGADTFEAAGLVPVTLKNGEWAKAEGE